MSFQWPLLGLMFDETYLEVTLIITSDIKLDEFNNCPGAQVVKDALYQHYLLPYLQVVDLDDTYAYTNEADTLVLAITDASMVNIALALGALATRGAPTNSPGEPSELRTSCVFGGITYLKNKEVRTWTNH